MQEQGIIPTKEGQFSLLSSYYQTQDRDERQINRIAGRHFEPEVEKRRAECEPISRPGSHAYAGTTCAAQVKCPAGDEVKLVPIIGLPF